MENFHLNGSRQRVNCDGLCPEVLAVPSQPAVDSFLPESPKEKPKLCVGCPAAWTATATLDAHISDELVSTRWFSHRARKKTLAPKSGRIRTITAASRSFRSSRVLPSAGNPATKTHRVGRSNEARSRQALSPRVRGGWCCEPIGLVILGTQGTGGRLVTGATSSEQYGPRHIRLRFAKSGFSLSS